MELSLQEQYAPAGICFGCGPANPNGLHIRSFARGEELHAEWTPQPYHAAFPGVLNGGIIGTLLDCHANWTAAYHLMRHHGGTRPPGTVTAEYTIKMLRPTPMDLPLTLVGRLVGIEGRRATTEAEIFANGEVTATCRGVFVAVKQGHPAFHRWESHDFPV